MSTVPVYIPSPYNLFLYFLGGQVHKDSKLGIMTNAITNRIVKVIFTNIHEISDAFANVQFDIYIMTAFKLCIKCYSIFSGKMVFLRKLKFIYPAPPSPQHYNNCAAPKFLVLFKKFLAPPLFREDGRDYAFYMGNYKEETIKLLSFCMTDFLFTEL